MKILYYITSTGKSK